MRVMLWEPFPVPGFWRGIRLKGRSHCFRFPPAEIGVALTGLGIAVQFLGVIFLFDRGLLAIGNVRWTFP